LEANSLAIQIHGGYGYTRDFPVEQYWRDQRLNMIHEGTHGIQAMDLLGRKVLMDKGLGLTLLGARMAATMAQAKDPQAHAYAQALKQAWSEVLQATDAASQGISQLLMFLTFLSANLAIVNFLPIPALDGGHMMFLIAEAILGRPIDEELQAKLTIGGVLSLLTLMAWAIFNDYINLSRYFGG
jgi:Zn-dependent protease